MKTIEEGAIDSYNRLSIHGADLNENDFTSAFRIGASFVNTWYSVDNFPPINTVVLCKVEDYYIIGRFDGEKWINDSDLSTETVTHWRLIF